MRVKFLFAAIMSLVVLPGLSHTMIGGTGTMSVDTRAGDLELESSWHRNSTFDVRLSTRWDSSESGILKVNGEEKSALEVSAETDYPLVVEANVATTFECVFTVGGSTYSRTLHTSGAKKMRSSSPIAYDSVVKPDGSRNVKMCDTVDLPWDAAWIGGDANATVVIADNGTEVKRTTGAGAFTHTLMGDGRHELTYTTYIGGVAQDEVYTTTVYKDWKYEVVDGGAVITETTQTSGTVAIPTEIDGYPVTGIASGAFKDCTGLTSVMIPESVTQIASGRYDASESDASAYYAFNGNLQDGSTNGLHLANHGATLTSDRFGNADAAYSFNGQEQYVSLDSSNGKYDCVAEGSFTVALWFKTSVTRASHGSSSTAWNPGNYVFYPVQAGSKAGYGIKVGTDGIDVVEHGSGYLETVLTYTANIGDGWNHVAVTVADNGNPKLYLNGRYVATGSGSSRVKRVGLWGIGGCNDQCWGFYTGVADDVVVFARALEAGEIESIYDGASAFVGFTNLTSVTVPWALLGEMSEIFPDSYGQLTNVTLTGSVTEIPAHAFAGCARLTELDIPSTVTSIGASAFAGCASLTSLTIPSEVSEIGEGAFDGCTGLRNVTIPASVTHIGSAAFASCSNLTEVVIPGSVWGVGEGAFADCANLRRVEAAKGLKGTLEAQNVFEGCPANLEIVYVETATISNVAAKQRYPWNGKVDITYTLTGDVTAGLPPWNMPRLFVTASNRVDGATYAAAASALSGDTGTAEGAHHVVWDLNAQGLEIKSDEVVFAITYVDTPKPYCVIDLSGGANALSYPVTYVASVPSGGFNTDEYKTTKLVLRLIEPGTFMMGGSYQVTLTKPFYCGVFEVTQKQWELVTGSNPCSSTSYGKGDSYPVHYVSYNMIRGSSAGAGWPGSTAVDGSSFLGKLQARTGIDFDLPTEAQWEYACRAGTTTTYSYGSSADGNYMWYSGNSSSKSHVVGTKQPNAWGLYDMHGNVYEWCLDWYGNLVGET